jgi:hypothetical protein
MFWAFNLSFIFLAIVLATFPNIWPSFVQYSGHSGCHAAAWVMDVFCNCHIVKNYTNANNSEHTKARKK